MRRTLLSAACALGALTACAGCGGFSVQDQGDGSSGLKAGQIKLHHHTVLKAPGGGHLRVALTSYDPKVRERSPSEPDQPVAGFRLTLRNVGKKPLRLGPPQRYVTLLGIDGLGENAVNLAKGPCSSPWQAKPIRLRPGKSTKGCVPYSYPTDKPPFEFIFSFSKHSVNGWILPH
jgi:hypothetical protein